MDDVAGEDLCAGLEERLLVLEVVGERFGEERGEGRVEVGDGVREGREGGCWVDFAHAGQSAEQQRRCVERDSRGEDEDEMRIRLTSASSSPARSTGLAAPARPW